MIKFLVFFASCDLAFTCWPSCGSSAIQPLDSCHMTLLKAEQLARRVLERDRTEWAFPLDLLSSSTEQTEIGVCRIRNWIARTPSSVIFEATHVDSETPLIAKYAIDCTQKMMVVAPRRSVFGRSLPPHPLENSLVREFAIAGAVSRAARVSAQVISISGPLPYDLSPRFGTTQKMQFGFSWDTRDACIAANSEVRLLLQQRVGMTVLQFRAAKLAFRDNEVLYLKEGVWVGQKSLHLLRELHSHGVVHGDFHAANVAFLETEPPTSSRERDLVLIDFGEAALMCGPRNLRKTPPGLSTNLLSVWQLEGDGLKGFRDDAFRLFELLADWISSGAFRRMLKSILNENEPSQAETLVHMAKSQLRYFSDNPPITFGETTIRFSAFQMYQKVPMESVETLQSLLETGMDHIRSLPTPESPVDFELLSGLLLQAELVLNSADPDLALGSVLELAEEDVVD